MFNLSALYQRLSVMLELPRSGKQILLMSADALVLLGAIVLAYYLRLGDDFSPNAWQLLLIVLYPLLGIFCLLVTNVYKQIIRYTGDELITMLFKAITLATFLWAAFVYVTKSQMMGNTGAPRAVPFLFWALSLLGVYGIRRFSRSVYWSNAAHAEKRATLIYGAGESAFRAVQALSGLNDIRLVGVVDHDPARIGRDFMGFRVYPAHSIAKLADKYKVRECIIATEKPGSAEVKDAIYALESHHIHTRILPPFSDIVSGKNLVSMIRDVDVGDLLGRQPVDPDPRLLSQCITGKVVMVTGAGGSIGFELCMQIAALQPDALILFEHSEPSLYQVHRRLLSAYSGRLLPVLGTVCDRNQLDSLFREYKVQTVYHAAAYKHVPLVEDNIAKGVENNIDGTLNVAELAYQHKVERFVLVSTDKAVRPTNVMGATKRWAEIGIQNLARRAAEEGQQSVFSAVRFGNVLGSSGSVIPLFKEQIQRGGPVTVTHPEINRFFMSIFEAAQLVIQAGSLAKGGDVFVLDMGESVKIVDLAKNMIKLAGLEPLDPQTGQGDIAIEFTGLRPGEKLYEELLIDLEGVSQTVHPKIMTAVEPFPHQARFDELRQQIKHFIKQGQMELVRQTLIDLANQRNFSNS